MMPSDSAIEGSGNIPEPFVIPFVIYTETVHANRASVCFAVEVGCCVGWLMR